MRYQVIIENHVDKETKNISQRDMQRIDKVILSLRDNPRPFGYIIYDSTRGLDKRFKLCYNGKNAARKGGEGREDYLSTYGYAQAELLKLVGFVTYVP